MTREQFEQKTRRKNLNKFIIETLIAFIILGVGLLLTFKLYFTDWFERAKPNAGEIGKTIPYVFGFGTILLGVYGLRRVLNGYKVITIRTDLDTEKNIDLVDKIAETFNWTFLNRDSWTEYFGKTNRLFGYRYTILVFADNGAIHMDIQTISSGIIDFGDRGRLIKKLERAIAASLQQNV